MEAKYLFVMNFERLFNMQMFHVLKTLDFSKKQSFKELNTRRSAICLWKNENKMEKELARKRISSGVAKMQPQIESRVHVKPRSER